jgi:hypothetical protein
MRTVKRNPFLAGVCAVLGGVSLVVSTASAEVTSDRAAGLVVFPKLVFDGANGVDTEIQLSNTSNEQIKVRCFYVNANGHCSNNPEFVCNAAPDCRPFGIGGQCIPGWQEIDFEFTMSPKQPIGWNLSTGARFLPLSDLGLNEGSIPGASEDPFRGELKCFQVGPDNAPVDRNDLKGEATIVTSADDLLDSRSYNAIGIPAFEGANDGDNVLRLGEEYSACPSYLILDHFFEDAQEPIDDAFVRTDITLVPCSENFDLQNAALFETTLQLLVFNEFEQRLSASIKTTCFKEIGLTDIGLGVDRPFEETTQTSNDKRSIFSVYVQGTLTGQTRIRAVDDDSETHGNGFLGVAEEFHREDETDLTSVQGSAAFNIHQSGIKDRVDLITVP